MNFLQDRRVQIAIAVVFVLIILALAFGWFGGGEPPATTTPAPTQ